MRKLILNITGFFRAVLQFLLTRPLTRLANKISSAPKQDNVNQALTNLYRSITTEPGKKGPLIAFRPDEQPVIIFTDMHKGTRNGADDFAVCEANYLAALAHYNNRNFYYLNLGDSEELWENILPSVIKHNKETFAAEAKFIERNAKAPYITLTHAVDGFFAKGFGSAIKAARRFAEGKIRRIRLVEALQLFR